VVTGIWGIRLRIPEYMYIPFANGWRMQYNLRQSNINHEGEFSMKSKRMIWLIISMMSMVFSVGISLYAEIRPPIKVLPLYASAKNSVQSPFAVFLRVTGLEPGATDYIFRLLIGDNESGSFTTTSCGSFDRSYKEVGIPNADGTVKLWVYLRNSVNYPEPGPCHLKLRIKEGGSVVSGSPWNLPGPTFLDMSRDGAWVYASTIFTEPGKAVLAFDSDDQIIGTYVTEDNDIDEKYPSTQGYFKIVVPANTYIPKLEARNADNTTFDIQTGDKWRAGSAGTETNLDDRPIETRIPEVQGDGLISPMVGQLVKVVGVVIGDLLM